MIAILAPELSKNRLAKYVVQLLAIMSCHPESELAKFYRLRLQLQLRPKVPTPTVSNRLRLRLRRPRKEPDNYNHKSLVFLGQFLCTINARDFNTFVHGVYLIRPKIFIYKETKQNKRETNKKQSKRLHID